MQILCATDFSQPGTEAANVAGAMARRLDLPLRLLHCAQDWVVMGDVPVKAPDDPVIRDRLKSEAERLRAIGIVVTEELRRGTAYLEIMAAASERPTTMIVLGSFGKGMAERWLVGSVTERVAQGATVPTLVVRQPESVLAWLSGNASLRLLCGVDFTRSADTASAAMRSFIALGRVEVEAVHIHPAHDSVALSTQQEVLQRDVWERLHAVLGDIPIKVHVREVVGHSAAEFLKTAEEQKSALLVVGTHQRHGWQRLKAPSFSRSVVAHATTNVLCVPVGCKEVEVPIPAIRRVLLATNFTDVCTEALRHACSLLPSGGVIHVVHVCEEPRASINPIIASEIYFDHSLATAKEKADATEKLKAMPSLVPMTAGVDITSEILVRDDVTAAICEAADRSGADVICMGTQGHSRTGAALLGSTVQGVLARAHKPVLAVPPPLL